MTRLFLILVCLLFSAPAVLGQSVHGKVTMKSGRVLHGRIVEIHEDRVQLRVHEGVLSIDRKKIAEIVEIDPRAIRQWTAASPLGETIAVDVDDGAEAGDGTVDDAAAPTAPVTSAASSRSLDDGMEVADGAGAHGEIADFGPDVELSRMIDRYLWFVPQKPGHRLTLGAALFLCLTLVVHLSSKMANFDNLTFGKSLGVTALIFLVIAIELTFAPVHPGIIAGICFVNVVLWFLSIQLIYRAGMYPAVVMLFSFLLAGMVGVLSLEVMGFVVQRTLLV